MRFLADVGVSRNVESWLLAQGHDVEHLVALGLERLSDALIFDRANDHNRVILTFDLDFGEILARTRSDRVSVILFRLSDASASSVIDRLQRALESSASELAIGAIVVVEDHHVRIRRLPIGR